MPQFLRPLVGLLGAGGVLQILRGTLSVACGGVLLSNSLVLFPPLLRDSHSFTWLPGAYT